MELAERDGGEDGGGEEAGVAEGEKNCVGSGWVGEDSR